MPGIHPSMVNRMLMRTSRSHAFLLMNTASGGRNIATMMIPISFIFLLLSGIVVGIGVSRCEKRVYERECERKEGRAETWAGTLCTSPPSFSLTCKIATDHGEWLDVFFFSVLNSKTYYMYYIKTKFTATFFT